MTEFRIDSWNNAQLERLKHFFKNSAKEGDIVVFDRALAEENAPSLEGFDDEGLNSFVIRAANMALNGLSLVDIERISNEVTLTTRYLHGTPDPAQQQNSLPPQEQPEEEDEYELELDLMERQADTKVEVESDAAAEWAATLARYHSRTPEMS